MMTIGQLAKIVGVNPQTLRFYERKGLLPPPSRSGSGNYRSYGDEDAVRMRFILRAKQMGFTLKEIQEVLQADEQEYSCQTVSEVISKRLCEVGQRIKELQAFRGDLSRMQTACDQTSDSDRCPVLARLS